MRTLPELEAAIEELPTPHVLALAAWLEELKQRRCGGAPARPSLASVLRELNASPTANRTQEDIDAALRHERENWE